MKTLTSKEILNKIDLLEPFDAVSEKLGLKLSIKSYVPYICTAIHAGSNLNERLNYKINLFSFQRWQEEDPCTDDFIANQPITITALDSRYEYDLNRERDICIYDEAWGKKVWKTDLTSSERRRSLDKYDEFYSIIKALVTKLEFLFKNVFIFDIHSYNYRRATMNKEYPLFNLGTHYLNEKYNEEKNYILDSFGKIDLGDIKNVTAENDIFYGKGYFAQFISENFENTALFPIEVKKVYCNENSGSIYDEVVMQLKENFNEIISNFVEKYTENFSYHILDNFSSYSSTDKDRDIANSISLLMKSNYVNSNDDKEYSADEISHLISNKTKEVILERLEGAYTVFVCHFDKVIACGSIVKKDSNIEAKMLNVDNNYKRMGIAKKICDIRENYARSKGYKKVYIESLKFENTLKFHESRGFYKTKGPRELKYSVYMCKDL